MGDSRKKWEDMQEEKPESYDFMDRYTNKMPMEKPKKEIEPIQVFYVKVNGENYSAISEIAGKMGCKLFGEENFNYSHVIFNLTSEKQGFLPSKHFSFTGRDRHDKIPLVSYIDLENVLTFIKTAKEGTEEMSFSYGENLLEKHWEEIAKKKEGAKYSGEKAPMATMLRQFPLALEAVAFRSKLGHEKYKEHDHDWMNFKRVPDAINQYSDATVRHLAGVGGDEDDLEHLKAAAWNILATLQLILEENG